MGVADKGGIRENLGILQTFFLLLNEEAHQSSATMPGITGPTLEVK